MPDEIWFLSACEMVRALQAGELSAFEVVRTCLERIDAVNPALNAVVQISRERAEAEARAADDAFAHGDLRGPLHGLPFTVKDTLDLSGVPGAIGVQERVGLVPALDATVVARLRGAGAIALGKTNTPPWGGGIETDNPVYGRTNNPYDLDRTPGGSSGGEAAIIAAGGSPLGLGSDSGGSLRLPAHNCGIATIKPTVGRVPTTTGGSTNDLADPRTQVGLLARRVEDLALTLPLIAGVDWRDAAVVPMPWSGPETVELAGLRVAFYTADGISAATPEIQATVRSAAQALAAAVSVVEEQAPPGLEQAWPITQEFWDSALRDTMTVGGFNRLLRRWGRYRTLMLRFMEHWDAIICPVSALPAVPHGSSVDFEQALMISYTVPYNLTGWPAVVVRGGTSPEGLPLGVQVVARPWHEDVALALAAQIEHALGGWQRPPL